MILIHQFLKISVKEYEDQRLQLWFKWCEAKSMNQREWQRLLASSAINKWFNIEVAKRERHFYNDVQAYQDWMTAAELTEKYKVYMNELFALFLRPHQTEISNISRTVKEMYNTDNYINLNLN